MNVQGTKTNKKRYALKDSKSDKVYYALVNILLALFFLAILLPLINIVVCSFSDPQQVNSGHVLFWPVNPNFSAYQAVMEYPGIMRSYANSFLYTILGTAINLIMTLGCAYPLARRNLPFKKPVVWLFMFTMLFSGGTMPGYLLIKDLHMLDTIWAMVLPGAISVYNLIIARTFIMNIPTDIEEAAKIDGSSDIRYFLQIVLPLSKTVIAVLGLYYAVDHWNDYFTAFLYLTNPDKMPLQIALRTILVNSSFSEASGIVLDEETMLNNQARQDLMKYALILFSSVPVLVLYPFIKKYFLKGVMLGAVKG